jgi:uncharacterized protein (TIGR00251 family)
LPCFRAKAGAIVLAVRLTPKGGRDAIDGVATLGDAREVALVRVRAVPEDGAANAALVGLLAKTFKRPKSAVAIVAGATARLKQVRISGEPRALSDVVETWPVK